MSAAHKKSLGESLVEEGIITAEQLKRAQAEEKRLGLRLRKVLVRLELIEEEDLVAFLSSKFKLPRIELNNYLIDPQIINLVPEELAREYELIPVLKVAERITCAMLDPWNIFALDEIRLRTNLTVEVAVATETEIKKAIDEYYGAKGSMEDLVKLIGEDAISVGKEEEMDVEKLQDIGEKPMLVKLVNVILSAAVREGASDIHIEPEKDALRIRIRVDGVLREIPSLPKYLQSLIVSRVKIMSDLDIAERRKAQDGRFTVNTMGKEIDVRVSTLPTVYGENVVLRFLDISSALIGFTNMGFSKEVLAGYLKLITRPHGIILVTGPSGSGKSTTLYASLNEINSVEKNIITIEDPIEYKLEGIRQTQVNPKVDLTFANGLRSILRQDPDVIMVGEMRDGETARIAIQAALTGHLVFSTLHTNDAPGAITRMIDMGIEPFLVSSSVIGVLAQRLIRIICPDCKKKYKPREGELTGIGLDPAVQTEFYKGEGCDKCKNTGYKGRIGIYELMVPNNAIRDMVLRRASSEEIRKEALLQGMISLKADGIRKVQRGLATVEEVLRVAEEG
ncbi:MAG: Flp pilus assembly complex ATPase component TadA [Candidatus Omnitrophica bacterium]|nr:Flp pilus assembly complex ATPase component TadA [Candidatus Omnitrophota bacterium]